MSKLHEDHVVIRYSLFVTHGPKNLIESDDYPRSSRTIVWSNTFAPFSTSPGLVNSRGE